MEDLTRYTVVHFRTVAVLFMDTRPVDAIPFHHDLLGADDTKSFFTLSVLTAGSVAVASGLRCGAAWHPVDGG